MRLCFMKSHFLGLFYEILHKPFGVRRVHRGHSYESDRIKRVWEQQSHGGSIETILLWCNPDINMRFHCAYRLDSIFRYVSAIEFETYFFLNFWISKRKVLLNTFLEELLQGSFNEILGEITGRILGGLPWKFPEIFFQRFPEKILEES